MKIQQINFSSLYRSTKHYIYILKIGPTNYKHNCKYMYSWHPKNAKLFHRGIQDMPNQSQIQTADLTNFPYSMVT